MSEQHTILSMLHSVMSGVKNIADVNTIVGNSIEAPNSSIIIPISKVSIGFGVGGSDINSKLQTFGDAKSQTQQENNNKFMFGGGTGAGITLSPVTFLVLSKDKVEIMNISQTSNKDLASSLSKVINTVVEYFRNRKKKQENKCHYTHNTISNYDGHDHINNKGKK